MKNSLKKILSLLLAALTLISFTSCGLGKNRDDDDEESEAALSSLRAEFSYENEYTLQHLEFLESAEYKDIVAVSGGLASNVANNYEDAKLNYVNGSWKALSKAVAAVGEGEIELINEYEILVSELMQNSGAEAGYVGSFQENYYTAVLELFTSIKEQISSAKDATDIFTGEGLEKASELATYLDGAIEVLSKLDGVSDSEAETLYSDAMAKVKEAFDSDFIKGNEAFVEKMTGALGVASDVTSFVSDSISDVVDEYVMYQAMSSASEEWEMVWESISSNAKSFARSTSDKKLADSYEKIAKCIDTILERTRTYRKSNAAAIFESTVRNGSKNMVEFAYSAGYEVWDGMMKCWPVGAAIKGGLLAGVGAANLLANSDDIAYYGQMLIGYGRVAEAAFDAMTDAARTLNSKKNYKSALLFDKAFNVYKDIQLSAASCAINYLNSIKTSTLGFIFKYTTDDEEAEILLIQIHIADWSPIKCHGIQKIYNNGGNVVGYNGNVYFFKLSADSLSATGTFGYFTTNTDVKNKLVCRNADGKEKTIIETYALGNIYICGEKLFYKRYDTNDWYSVGFDGKGEMLATQAEIVGYIEKYGMLIVQSENGYYAADFTGNRTEAFMDYENGILSLNGDYIYHYKKVGEDSFSIYRTNYIKNTTETVGSVSIDLEDMWYAVIEEPVATEKGVYFMSGQYGGTGYFFEGEGIYFISYEDASLKTIHEGFIGAPYIEIAYENDTEYLYYYEGMPISNTGTHYGALGGEIYRINTKTLEITEAAFELCDHNTAFMWNGELKINIGETAPKMLISKSNATRLGYKSLGARDDRSQTYHEWVEYVNGTYYISIVDVVYDESSEVGWRGGYKRISTKLFELNEEESIPKLVYSY